MNKRRFNCIDAHTCENSVRIVVDEAPKLQGNSRSKKRQHFLQEYDWIRKGLMFEPRGHDMMSGSCCFHHIIQIVLFLYYSLKRMEKLRKPILKINLEDVYFYF